MSGQWFPRRRPPEPASAPPASPGSVGAALWAAVPAALATELGSIAAMVWGSMIGVAAALAALAVLAPALPRTRPPGWVLRLALLVGGPPLRYGLLAFMVWYVWRVREEGPVPALAAALMLLVILPLIGLVLASVFSRRSGLASRPGEEHNWRVRSRRGWPTW